MQRAPVSDRKETIFPKVHGFVIYCALLATVVGVHHQAIFQGPVFDDFGTIEEVLRAPNFREFFRAQFGFKSTIVFRPLPMLLYYYPFRAFFGEDLWKYQLLTLISHTTIAFLIYSIGRRLSPNNGALPFLSAILFSLNTVYSTESIWFSGFLWCQTGYTLGLWALLLRFRQDASLLRHSLISTLYILGLLCYEPVASIGFLIVLAGLLVDWGHTTPRRTAGCAFSYLLLTLAYIFIMLVIFPRKYGNVDHWGVGLRGLTNLWRYISHELFPRNTFFFADPYCASFDCFTVPWRIEWLPGAFLASLGLVFIGYILWSRSLWTLFFGFWSIVTLLPFAFSFLVDTRWTYLSSAGVLSVLASGLTAGSTRSTRLSARSMAWLGRALAVPVVVIYAIGAYRVTEWFGDIGERSYRRAFKNELKALHAAPGDVVLFMEFPWNLPAWLVEQTANEAVGGSRGNSVKAEEVDREDPSRFMREPGRKFLLVPQAGPNLVVLLEVTDRPEIFSIVEGGVCVHDQRFGAKACREVSSKNLPSG